MVEAHRDQWTLTQSVNPVLVPQQCQQLVVQRRFKDLNVDLIVLVRVDTEIFDLAERDRLIFGRRHVGRGVVLRIGPEGTNIHFTSRDGAVGIDLKGRSD